MSILRRRIEVLVVILAIVVLTSCETTSPHQFAEPSGGWQVRTGQLMYASPTATLIGEVVVRFSRNGDFEFTLSKGPGVALIVMRQDASFANVDGPLAGGRWSGRVDQAPPRLQGWLGLRTKMMAALATGRVRPARGKDRPALRYVAGAETFRFRF